MNPIEALRLIKIARNRPNEFKNEWEIVNYMADIAEKALDVHHNGYRCQNGMINKKPILKSRFPNWEFK